MPNSAQPCSRPWLDSAPCLRLAIHLIFLSALLFLLACPILGQDASSNDKVAGPPAAVTIPDGTPVSIRFAEAIWGFPVSPFISDPPRPPFRKGDKVRIVAADDVELGGHIVIRKGSLGQATVTETHLVLDRKHPTTGIDLRVDWIKSISDEIVPLRPGKKGKPKSILLDVFSDHGGFSVDQSSLEKALLGAMTYQYVVKSVHQKLWVPVGTRMMAFVHGDTALDPSHLAEALARLPLPNTTGLITIYRVKGQKEQNPSVYCDGKQVAQVGSRQFFELELTPGVHNFAVDKGDPVQLPVSAGKEYYLFLRWRPLTGTWKLDTVSTPEGEDGIADGEMVSPN